MWMPPCLLLIQASVLNNINVLRPSINSKINYTTALIEGAQALMEVMKALLFPYPTHLKNMAHICQLQDD